ncbi:MAG: translocation/assembly module TamB domain-containing protein [Candidatus Babeliales bacterium]
MRFLLMALLAILLGFSASIYLLQHNEQFKITTQQKLQTLFDSMFDCESQCTLKELSILPLLLTANQIKVKAPDKTSWEWQAESFSLKSSWINFLLSSNLGLEIILDSVRAQSTIDNNSLAIVEHLKKFILDAEDIPVSLKSLIIRKGLLHIIGNNKSIEGILAFSSESAVIADQFRSTLYITDGNLSIKSMPILQALTLHANIEKRPAVIPKKGLSIFAEGNMHLPIFPKGYQKCYISTHVKHGDATLLLRNKAHKFLCELNHNTDNNQTRVKGLIPLNYLQNIWPISSPVNGVAQFDMHIDHTNDNIMNGSLTIQDIYYNNMPIGSLTLTFHKESTNWTGTIRLINDEMQYTGDWTYNQSNKEVSLSLHNSSQIAAKATGSWVIEPYDFTFNILSNSESMTGNYKIKCTHKKLHDYIETKGNISLKDALLTLTGTLNKYNYAIEALLTPNFILQKFFCTDENNNILVTTNFKEKNNITLLIDYQAIRSLLAYWLDQDIRGKGIVEINLGLENDHQIMGNISMKDGHIQVPQTYNFIHQLNGNIAFNLDKKTLIVSDGSAELTEGVMRMHRATILWDDKLQKFFMHAPFLLENVFLNLERELFAVLSGALLLCTNDANGLTCKGNISIDKSECKKNIFSIDAQQSITSKLFRPVSGYNILCDIALTTHDPLHIKTFFLTTDVNVGLSIKNRINNPEILGSISLTSGILNFPYKPLYITRAHVYFLPHQLDDPAIELIAKGKIKKYHITLRITGSLKHPHIVFEATPPLTEEQIITLLLAGSEEGSFALAMPTMVMQNLQQLMFGSDQSLSKVESYFNAILSPLKHIRIVPSFVDQMGRGGFRGGIEIEVSERLRALIQKNFSLTEDTKFEVEYLLSDDITIRGIKDERSDLGGEVEMRWKF